MKANRPKIFKITRGTAYVELLLVENNCKKVGSSGERWDEQYAVSRVGIIWIRRRDRPSLREMNRPDGKAREQWLDSHEKSGWKRWAQSEWTQADYFEDAKWPDSVA